MKKSLFGRSKAAMIVALLAGATLCTGFLACGNKNKVENQTTKDSEKETSETENEKKTGLMLHYDMSVEGKNIKDKSGNGNDGTIVGNGYTVSDGTLFLENGTYVKLPTGMFDGENILTISLWLNNYTGAGNYSAMFFGTTESMPKSYWLLNPCNPSDTLKSVFTDTVDAGAPYNTEVGISPSKQSKGVTGPKTGIGWNHYVTVITESEIIVYMNGVESGRAPHKRQVSDFGDNLVAFIGKSSYSDPTYVGFVRDVRVYNEKLDENNIKKLYEDERGKVMNETKKAESEYNNPFIVNRADPYIVKGNDGYYYFTASYPMFGANDTAGYDRIVLRRSKTLEGLAEAEEITIWDEENSDQCHCFIWAPEMHYIGGKWYVYYAASGSAQNVWDINCNVIMCEGDDPYTDNWVEKGKFQTVEGDNFSFTEFSLDMTYFENKGKHYVIWAQKKETSNLYIATIDEKEPWKLTSMPMLLTEPEYYWEKVRFAVNEGPSVLKHGGKVFVCFSAAGTGTEYCVGLLSADDTADLMDKSSWTKYDKPLLTSEDLYQEYGPGHNSFTVDEEGNYVFVYHARSQECFEGKCGYAGDPLFDPCRHARLRKVLWASDGTPILNGVQR